MAAAKTQVEFYIFNEAEKNMILGIAPGLESYFVQYVGYEGYFIPADTIRTWDEDNNNEFDFDEDFLMEYQSRYFTMSTMIPANDN